MPGGGRASACLPHRVLFESADFGGERGDFARDRMNAVGRSGRGEFHRTELRIRLDDAQLFRFDLARIIALRQEGDAEACCGERRRDAETLAGVDAAEVRFAGMKPVLDRLVVIGLLRQADDRNVVEIARP